MTPPSAEVAPPSPGPVSALEADDESGAPASPAAGDDDDGDEDEHAATQQGIAAAARIDLRIPPFTRRATPPSTSADFNGMKTSRRGVDARGRRSVTRTRHRPSGRGHTSRTH